MSKEDRPEESSGAEAQFPQTFRPSVLLLYLMLSIPTQVVFGTLLGIRAWTDFGAKGRMPTEVDMLAGGLLSVCCGICLIPPSLLLAHYLCVRVGPLDIETRDARGFRCILSWDGIESVEVVKFWCWRTLRVRTITGRQAWIPVHMARGEAYREAVAYFAGEDHPISRALATSSPSSSR